MTKFNTIVKDVNLLHVYKCQKNDRTKYPFTLISITQVSNEFNTCMYMVQKSD